VQTRGSSHEGSDPGCVSIPLAVIFGYFVGNIVEHVLEKIGRILMARSSGMRLRTGGYVAGRNWQAEWMEFLWTVGDENERNIA
jgi:hypothetical protein